MRVGIIQMNIALGRKEENLAKAVDLVYKGTEEKADVILLPEMWNTSYDLKNIHDLADDNGVPCGQRMAQLAKELQVNIIAGSIADKREGKVYNTSYVFDRKGENIARYSKVHLFGLMEEGDYLTAGNKRCLFEIDGVKCGLIICYDLRFPELSRALALDGAQIIFAPAQWPHPRMHPWRILTQARAIENQLYLVAANRVGREGPKVEFFGHSMAVDPLGEVIYEGSGQEEIKIVELDLAKISKVRKKMTCFQDRVEAVYQP